MKDAIGTDLTYINFYLLAPTVSNQSLNLTFILAVSNIQDFPQPIEIRTRTFSGSNSHGPTHTLLARQCSSQRQSLMPH